MIHVGYADGDETLVVIKEQVQTLNVGVERHKQGLQQDATSQGAGDEQHCSARYPVRPQNWMRDLVR